MLTFSISPMMTRLLSRARTGTQATQIHAYLTTTNQLQKPLLHTQLINLYTQCGLFSHALLVFESVYKHSNIITWTSLITHLAHNHQPLHAFRLFTQLLGSTPLRPNHFTLSALLPACAQTGSVMHGEQVHTLARKLGLECDVFVASALLDMYAKCANVDSSRKVFDEMPVRNLVSWNSLIVGFTQNKRCDMAMETFKGMHAECSSICFDEVNVSSVLSACAGGGLGFGRGVHGSVVKVGMESLVYVNNSLIDMYAKCGCFQDAVEVFDRARGRDVVTWNAMMVGWVHSDRMEEVCKYFWAMRRDGTCVPDEASFSTALHACANMATWCHGTAVHSLIIKAGFESNPCVASSLITMYAKCGCLNDAHRVFDESREYVNVVSWTAIIAAFQQHGHGDVVVKLFDEMLERGIEPDYITYVCVLSACSHNGLIEQGFKYFDSMSRVHGMAPESEHYACMVDMLGRAGRLDEAKQFIDTMPIEPDASVWGALLGACRNCGDLEMGREVAQRLFEIEPDNPGSYVLLANMYALHGRLEEARRIRTLMKISGVRKETGCSWIDIKNNSIVFTAHDQSHERTKEIYEMLAKLQEFVKQKGYVADTRYAINDVGDGYKEQGLWYHSERLALAFGLISLPENAPIRIMKNLRTCGDCHSVMKLLSGIVQREIVLRDTNRFHHFFDGSCSCRDYW